MLQLPAVNTPQFEAVRTRLPRHPKPVPPIYTPELMASAVLHAAEHPVREMIVGGSTLRAILAQKFIPGLLDRYLARSGYDAQQTDWPVERNRPDNLFAPVPGDPGAHGPFTAESKNRSLQLWVRLHAGEIVTIAGVVTLAACIGARRGRTSVG
jgi:hypothetical protein